MNRIILRHLNFPFLVLLAVLTAAIQTSLFSFYPLMYLQPDLLLLFTVWFALRRRFVEGGVLVLIVGEIAEIHSSAPSGMFLVSYMTCYLSLRAMARYLVVTRLSSLVSLTLFASVLWKLVGLLVLALMDSAAHQWRHTFALMPFGAAMTGLAGVWVFGWLEKLDWATYKDPRAAQALEDELRLSEEGL
ncbi:MAG: rod shape-determining protein MreD [Bdellovibrionales bacterium]|nr:rod shape-determining protein MreD [Bdellovibrionales bacterium]